MENNASLLQRLHYFPASFFGMIMGMTGLCLALLKSETLFGWSLKPGYAMLIFIIVLFTIMLAAYLYKNHPFS